MTERVPLPEQLDEVRSEYARRCQAYPLLVARGEMRTKTMEAKIERMAAVHNTLAWLFKHADEIKEWVSRERELTDDVPSLVTDAPMEVLDDLPWEEVDGEAETEPHQPYDEAGRGAGVPAPAGAAGRPPGQEGPGRAGDSPVPDGPHHPPRPTVQRQRPVVEPRPEAGRAPQEEIAW